MKSVLKSKLFVWLAMSALWTLFTFGHSAVASAELNHSDAVVRVSDFKVGKPAALWVGFNVHNGFKWNKKFPSKVLFLKKPENFAVPVASFENSDFYVDENLVLVPVRLIPTKKGSEKIKILLRFSVCNDAACHVETVQFDINVTVDE